MSMKTAQAAAIAARNLDEKRRIAISALKHVVKQGYCLEEASTVIWRDSFVDAEIEDWHAKWMREDGRGDGLDT